MSIGILGAGAFGTAMAVTLARAGREVMLWGRDAQVLDHMRATREIPRLPGVALPDSVVLADALQEAAARPILLLAVPMQSLSALLDRIGAPCAGQRLVACCKGIDIASGTGPSGVIGAVAPEAVPAVLTGPSFAADIARGLPTALTLACADETAGHALQHALATPTLRLYRSTDTAGAELGGALKNVIAIACGASIGEGLGESARAALMTRGFAEMTRLAPHFGARPETLAGLSGLGDLALTCTSEQSRNYRFGLALGRGEPFDSAITVEGARTAEALARLRDRHGFDLPISRAVHQIAGGQASIAEAIRALLSRPLREE
ncbi:MAG: NAD(P)H-dependent glycerol-3-phosphate dehydrogenase [Paracoccaceae bacterium]